MTSKKRKKLDYKLIYLLFTLIFVQSLLSCSDTNIYGKWTLMHKEVFINDENMFIEEITPNSLNDKFNKMFPSELKKNDVIEITRKGLIYINGVEGYLFNKRDSLISISKEDMVYNINYKILDDSLLLFRKTYQGSIEWTLIREKE